MIRASALFFAMIFAGPAFAETGTAATSSPVSSAKVEQIAADMEKSRQKIEREELRRRKVLAALYDLNRKLRRTVSEKSNLQSERAALEDNVAKLNERLAELDGISSGLRARLGERLKAIHRLGKAGWSRVLSSSGSASSLDRNLKILGLVARKDRDLAREYAAVRTEMGGKREKLANRLERLRRLEGDLKDRERRMADEQDMKNRLLDGIRKKRLFAEKNLEDLRRQSRDIKGADDAVLDLLFRPSFAEEKGRLQWPVPGPLLSRFGMEKTENDTVTLARKGIRIGAKSHQPVQSVFEGTVAWTGQIPGFGGTVVVDHGDHYYTVYANAGRVLVREGERVEKRQPVAVAGEGAVADAGLYFEIRHFSEPYDPQHWLKGTAL